MATIEFTAAERATLLARIDTLTQLLTTVTAERDALKAAHATSTPAAGPPPSKDVATVSAGGSTTVLAETGDVSFLSPRGRFKARLFDNHTALVGKSTEVVLPHASIQRMWLLPEPTGEGHSLLVLALDPPVANGKAMLSFVTLVSKPAEPEQVC
jgi:hypothetical protein